MTDHADQEKNPSPDTRPRTKHYTSYEDFYNDIPEEGSLGILAMGFQGVLAWRRKKEELKAARDKQNFSFEKSEENHG
ncbi:hypothetical protein JW835_00135 [bacterium]|nr:hypothetical protein [bacterium]